MRIWPHTCTELGSGALLCTMKITNAPESGGTACRKIDVRGVFRVKTSGLQE